MDDLVSVMIIIRHKFWCHSENKFSKYNGVYYILNFAHPKTTEILYLWKIKIRNQNQNPIEKVQLGNKNVPNYRYSDIPREELKELGLQKGLTTEDIDKLINECQSQFMEIVTTFRDIEALAPKLKQGKALIIALANSLIKVADFDRSNGLSPLDTLVKTTRNIKANSGWYECMWNLMEDAGFLNEYKYNLQNLL